MTLFLLLVTLGMLGCVLAVAAGRITGGLDDPATSVPSRGLPAGQLRPRDVDAVRFAPALRGYRMDQVDAALDRLSEELDQLRVELLRREEMLHERDGEVARLRAMLHQGGA